MQQKWRDRHVRATALKDRLQSIDQGRLSAADVDRLWDRAVALLDLEGGKAAIPLLQEIITMRPDHPQAQFHLGRLLLDENRPEGVQHLERAMEIDENCFLQACGLLHQHFRATGQAAQLRELDGRMDRHEKSLAASQAERREVSAKDTFIPHELAEADLQALREVLQPELRVLRAHLARKELKHFPKQRLFVLCLYSRRAWHGLAHQELDRVLVARVSQKLRLPGRLMVCSPDGIYRGLARKLARVPGAEVFFR